MRKLFCVVLWTCLLMAQTTATFAQENGGIPVVELNIKPNICVAPRGAETCTSRMDIEWSSNRPAHFCLHSSAANQVLQCWDGVDSGNYKHRVIMTTDIAYWMGMAGYPQKLAETTLRFAALKPHRKYPRRRNRLPWSIQ